MGRVGRVGGSCGISTAGEWPFSSVRICIGGIYSISSSSFSRDLSLVGQLRGVVVEGVRIAVLMIVLLLEVAVSALVRAVPIPLFLFCAV